MEGGDRRYDRNKSVLGQNVGGNAKAENREEESKVSRNALVQKHTGDDNLKWRYETTHSVSIHVYSSHLSHILPRESKTQIGNVPP